MFEEKNKYLRVEIIFLLLIIFFMLRFFDDGVCVFYEYCVNVGIILCDVCVVGILCSFQDLDY